MAVQIAPSILSCDFSRLGAELAAVEQAGADLIHVDVMDGHFVPNLTIGPLVVAAARRATTLPLDVHLMIESPERWLAAYAEAGADLLGVHAEACGHLHRAVGLIRELGKLPVVAVNPATSLEALRWILPDVHMVLVMTVNPGFGGQAFIPSMLPKLRALRSMITDLAPTTKIAVDGGVNAQTVGPIVQAGAEVLVAGSAVFGQQDYRAAINQLRAAGRSEGDVPSPSRRG